MSPSLDSTALVAAVSGALADPGADDREVLNSVVTVARSIFGAAASSVFLYDREAGELVFEAVSGEGAGFLVGTRFPADRGIAGWVVASGEPVTVADLNDSPLFARELAEKTGYVPESIMAVPILHRGELLGVLQVLDPHPQSRASIADLDLLMQFAVQAGWSLDALVRSRAVQDVLTGGGEELTRLAGIVQILSAMEPDQRQRGLRLVDSLHDLLAGMAH